MLGAASPLKAAGFTVDAVESRQFGDYLPTAAGDERERPDSRGRRRPPRHQRQHRRGRRREFFDALADVPKVIVLTQLGRSVVDRGEQRADHVAAGQFPNVTVGCWDTLAPGVHGQLLAASDGFHLSADGADYYTALITEWAGI